MSAPARLPLKDIFQWEVRSWSRALPLWEDHIPERRPLKALGIGEREGGLSLWLAMKGIDVICSDLHAFPEATRKLHQDHTVSAKIIYAQADVTALPYNDRSFDIVFFKSVIGALGSKEQQRFALNEIHRVLKPGGRLFFAENLHGTTAHRWLRKRFVAWNNYWRYLDPINDKDLFSSFQLMHESTTGCLANLGRSETQRDLLARVDRILVPLLPKRWRTIWYGVAVK